MTECRVPLPPSVAPPFTVYVNGVEQERGRDYRVAGRALVFDRPLVKGDKLGFWQWLRGAFGVGTYGQNDVVDVAHAGGLAHALDIEPPRG